jgi:hypothetical protein
VLVIPSDGLVGQVEHFGYLNDQPAGTYSETTYASTGATVPVSATALNVFLGSGSASGYSNEPITIHL